MVYQYIRRMGMSEKFLLKSGTTVYISSVGYYNYNYKEEEFFILETDEIVTKPQFWIKIARQKSYKPFIANEKLIQKYKLKSKIIWIKE